uniref:Interleukin 20 receptor subunit beta n=1 Tax=Oryctolagus cuniculus TaxID=9986 RepID=A0A5F9DSK7_RABIT
MVLEDICTSLVLWFFALIPCLLTDGVAILPAPSNLSVHSANMKHLLVWSPVALPGETVYYSVQYQGEYESLYRSHVWIPSSLCSLTERPQCDVSDDITATVPYNLRVRATLGSRTSAWSTLKQPFNRNSTVLTPPVVAISKDGFHLVIELEDLGPHFEFLVAYWRREPGAKEHLKVLRNEGVPVHLATMEPGAAYCVKAQTFVKAIQRHSAFSQPECVEVRGTRQEHTVRHTLFSVPTQLRSGLFPSSPPPHPARGLALRLPPGCGAKERLSRWRSPCLHSWASC